MEEKREILEESAGVMNTESGSEMTLQQAYDALYRRYKKMEDALKRQMEENGRMREVMNQVDMTGLMFRELEMKMGLLEMTRKHTKFFKEEFVRKLACDIEYIVGGTFRWDRPKTMKSEDSKGTDEALGKEEISETGDVAEEK